MAAHLDSSESLSFVDGELVIATPPGDAWMSGALARQRNRKILDDSVAAVWGEQASWRLIEGSGKAPEPEIEETDVPPEVVDHPMVQTVLDVFGGQVEAVDPIPPTHKE